MDIQRMAEALGSNESGTDKVREKALKERFLVEKDEELPYRHQPKVSAILKGYHANPCNIDPEVGNPGEGDFFNIGVPQKAAKRQTKSQNNFWAEWIPLWST
ncbi:hypothetical protein PAXRUDRAFT_18127 [Paxillus rubicundulus Ve08.2h10]|uniref:Uncharacterized protein n=1 Tax=Paxillus rubicundulus Ve08.2h10 TaxID=930991 RepID=A0A0D0DFK9_9AGAM|nr:hypothetical protein PAXRUDRAFT_18127 [Paxillus rubicundulus Ve08.2h10]